jgi:hypothetical protein
MSTPAYTLGLTRVEMQAMLREWQAASASIKGRAQAERYASAVAQILTILQSYTTVEGLVSAYHSPAVVLQRLVLDVCRASGAQLQPRLVIGAACAQRLRQLMENAIA